MVWNWVIGCLKVVWELVGWKYVKTKRNRFWNCFEWEMRNEKWKINWNQIVENKKFMFAKRVNVNKGKLSSWKKCWRKWIKWNVFEIHRNGYVVFRDFVSGVKHNMCLFASFRRKIKIKNNK